MENKPQNAALSLEMCIEGEVYYGMCDTGASDCFISQQLRDQLPEEAISDISQGQERVVKFGDATRSVIGETIRLKCSFDSIYVYYEFHVMEDLAYPIILGRNLLRDLRAELCPAKRKVTIFNENPVSVKRGTFIRPFEEKIVNVEAWETMEGELDQIVRLEPSGISAAAVEGAINYIHKTWWLRVANLTSDYIYLGKNDVLAYVEEAQVEPLDRNSVQQVLKLPEDSEYDTSSGASSVENCNLEVEKQEQQDKIEKILKMDLGNTCLTEEEQQKFREMLARNKDTLAFSMKELGHCDWLPMKIRVDESKGICHNKPYRYSPMKMDIIDEQVNQLLKMGIIEPSESAWRSPLVVVTKKDGSARLCTDYRVLNLMTEDDTYPMPTARSLFLYMAYRKPTIFTAMDLLSGYHQCDLHPDSRKYSAFESPSGVWQWTRVPFGMRQSPWQFTKIMSMALGGLMPRNCLAYLDDIIIFDPNVEEHINNVEKVLQALHKAGLTIKPSKCEWGRSEIKFLGHIVTPEGLKTLPKVTGKVQEFGRPHDKHTVRSFVGLCNYYRNFIPDFAQLSVPLNRLLKNKVTFEWTKECEDAFQKIQSKLVNPPLLVHPDIGGEFYVMTDASDSACGAAICKMKDEVLRPIVYYSYTFNKSEKGYGVTEREGLAVIKALKTHENMLCGGKVIIVTDHQPLIPLLQQAHKAPSARLRRWGLALNDFDYQLKYRPGEKHFLPDYLSRVVLKGTPDLGSDDDSDEYEEFEPEVGCELLNLEGEQNPGEVGIPPPADKGPLVPNELADEITSEEFRDEQWRDPGWKPILQYLVNNKLPEDWEETKNVLAQADRMGVNKKGVLCRFDNTKRKKNKGMSGFHARIVVPQALVSRVLYLMHDDIFCGGHVGITAVNTKIVEKFYWKNLYIDIVEYVRTCESCALRKRAPHFKSKTKTWERPDYPWQVVQTDFIGPLRKSEEGYQYILTFIDLLTGWPEAFPTKNCTAATAAIYFLQNIACRYGKVEVLNSDRGASYVSKLFREITRRLMCKQRFTSARMPQGNARVERLHKSLEDIMGCYITENHEKWPDLLPIALWSVRSTISTRTGMSPYALLYGRDHVSLGFPTEDITENAGSEEEWFLRTKHNIELYDKVARDNTEKYEKAMRDRLDKTARPVQFEEGNCVFYYDPTCAANTKSKFAPRYRGPYRVEEAVSDNRVRLRSLRTGKVMTHLINVNKLKRAYCDPDDYEDPVEERGEPPEELPDPLEDENEAQDPEEGKGGDPEGIQDAILSEESDKTEEINTSSEEEEEKVAKKKGKKGEGSAGAKSGDSFQAVKQVPKPQPEIEKGWVLSRGKQHGCADQVRAPKPSTPLVQNGETRRKESHSGTSRSLVKRLEREQVTTPPGSPVSWPDYPEQKERRDNPERDRRDKRLTESLEMTKKSDKRLTESFKMTKMSETSTDTEGNESPDSNEERDENKELPDDQEDPEITLKKVTRNLKVYEGMKEKGRAQRDAMAIWGMGKQCPPQDKEEREEEKKEKKLQSRWRTEQYIWDQTKEKAQRERERAQKRQERDERAEIRRKMRDKQVQKASKFGRTEENNSDSDEEAEKIKPPVPVKGKAKDVTPEPESESSSSS